MRAIQYRAFHEPLEVVELEDPQAPDDGVVIGVHAAGLCRSDWHGWQGHDDDISVLPHIPGHEFAGVIEQVGSAVRNWQVGDRVTAPFVLGCGACSTCLAGDSQVCPAQWQPGFHGPGAFAQRVAVPRADANLIRLPDDLNMPAAALLGCRFATGFRAAVVIGRVGPSDDALVLGCGGLGLSIIMVCAALGARVTAVDMTPQALVLAESCGATATVLAEDQVALNATLADSATVSFDATGSIATAQAGVLSLRPRGRHVQVGLLPTAQTGDRSAIPMGRVIARELSVLGSHGMPAHDYPAMLDFIVSRKIEIERIITAQIDLASVPAAMAAQPWPPGVTVIDPRHCS